MTCIQAASIQGLGLSIGWGLLAALDSLVSQAYGAGNQASAGLSKTMLRYLRS